MIFKLICQLFPCPYVDLNLFHRSAILLRISHSRRSGLGSPHVSSIMGGSSLLRLFANRCSGLGIAEDSVYKSPHTVFGCTLLASSELVHHTHPTERRSISQNQSQLLYHFIILNVILEDAFYPVFYGSIDGSVPYHDFVSDSFNYSPSLHSCWPIYSGRLQLSRNSCCHLYCGFTL